MKMKLSEYIHMYPIRRGRFPSHQTPVLEVLKQHPATLREISATLGKKPESVSWALGKLKRKGLVTVEKRVWRVV